MRRPSTALLTAVALLVAAPAAADVATPGTHIVPSDAVFTGLDDFPSYRFVVAVSRHRPDPDVGLPPIPAPVPVRDGERVPTDTLYFQELRAIPRDGPEPVSDAWVLQHDPPTSGSFTLRPYRARDGSDEERVRAHYHVRDVQGAWIALKLISSDVVLTGGATRTRYRPIPRSWKVESFEAPPGWQLFLMPDPARPATATATAPPAVRVDAGDVLPLLLVPRTLVAVDGALGPGDSLDGRRSLAWKMPLHAAHREVVPPDSPAVEHQELLEVRVDPNASRLEISSGERYRDARGDWFHDETLSSRESLGPSSILQIALAGSGVVLLLSLAAWTWRRGRARRAPQADSS